MQQRNNTNTYHYWGKHQLANPAYSAQQSLRGVRVADLLDHTGLAVWHILAVQRHLFGARLAHGVLEINVLGEAHFLIKQHGTAAR